MNIQTPADVPSYTKWADIPTYDKPMNNVCNYVKLLNHVGKIVEGLGIANPVPPEGADEEFTPHEATYLKLLLTSSYARTFLRVGSKYTNKLYYLDVLSASGLTYPGGDKQQPVPGSCFFVPLCHQDFSKPTTAPAFEFSKMWAFEADPACLQTLAARHKLMQTAAGFKLPPLQPVPGDVNQSILPVLDSLAKEREEDFRRGMKPPLILAFIDNLGLNVNMDTIHAIQTKVRADLVVHLPIRAIWRSIEQARKQGVEGKKLTAFFGTEAAWQGIKSQDDIPAAYQKCVQAKTTEPFQEFEPVIIKSKNQEFALCIYARRTKGMDDGHGGWIENIKKLAAACNEFTPDHLNKSLKVASGKQATLKF